MTVFSNWNWNTKAKKSAEGAGKASSESGTGDEDESELNSRKRRLRRCLRGHEYLMKYMYNVLCYGALQSTFAGIVIQVLLMTSMRYDRDPTKMTVTDSDVYALWSVLFWLAVDLLMGPYLIFCLLLGWEGQRYRYWVYTSFVTFAYISHYAIVWLPLLIDTGYLFNLFFVVSTIVRLYSGRAVWKYAKLKDLVDQNSTKRENAENAK